MNAGELGTLRKSWADQGDKYANGEKLLTLLLTKNPSYKELFVDFRGKSLDEIRPKVGSVSGRIMDKMGEFIANADKPAISGQVSDFVKQHKGFNVTADHFKALKGVMGDYLKQTGQGAAGLESAYGKLLDLIIGSY